METIEISEYDILERVQVGQVLDIEFVQQKNFSRFFLKSKKDLGFCTLYHLESPSDMSLKLWVDKSSKTLEKFGIKSVMIPGI